MNLETEDFGYFEVSFIGTDETEIVIGADLASVTADMNEMYGADNIDKVTPVHAKDMVDDAGKDALENHQLNVSVLSGHNPFVRKTQKVSDTNNRHLTAEGNAADEMQRQKRLAAISQSDKDKLVKVRAMLDKEKKPVKEDSVDFRSKSARASMTKKDRSTPNPQNKQPELESYMFTQEEIKALKKLKEHSLEQYFKLLNTLPKHMAEEANHILGVEPRSIRQIFADRLIERKLKMKEGTDLKNDKNHNGIDDKDEDEPKDNTVKKTEKMAKEDAEQVDELNKSTLTSYYDKAYDQRTDLNAKKNKTDAEKRKLANRNAGSKTAAHKIAPRPQSVKDAGAAGKAAAKQDARNAFIRDKVKPGKK